MWLIDTATLRLREVIDPEEAGVRYAILSHTWGSPQEEVSFRDFADLKQARSKAGFAKIEKTCEIARSQGIQYAWVDTCCIDKSSSAELSEAINSMFMWYRLSQICYIYLADLEEEPYDINQWYYVHNESNGTNKAARSTKDRDDHFIQSNFARCRWFSRGWTLQELIAPQKAVFYDSQWQQFASKFGIAHILSLITGIQEGVLTGFAALGDIPVFTRMSWAAKRTTTRVEDSAYCLLGLFDINFPLIYGEGPRAFRRLQEEIIRKTQDISILAWSGENPPGPKYRPRVFERWSPGSVDYRGALAWGPCEFMLPASCMTQSPLVERDQLAPSATIEEKTSRGFVLKNVCMIHRTSVEIHGTRPEKGDILQIPCLGGYVYRKLRRCPTGHVLKGPLMSRDEAELVGNGSSLTKPVYESGSITELREMVSEMSLLEVTAPRDVQDLEWPVIELEVSMLTGHHPWDKYYIQSHPVWPISRWSDADRCFVMNQNEVFHRSKFKLLAVQHIHHELHGPDDSVHAVDMLVGIGSHFTGPHLDPQSHQHVLVENIITRGSAGISSAMYNSRVDGVIENARLMKPLHWHDHDLFVNDILRRSELGEDSDYKFFLKMKAGMVEIPLRVNVESVDVYSRRSKYNVVLTVGNQFQF
jgi:hypothetical protein